MATRSPPKVDDVFITPEEHARQIALAQSRNNDDDDEESPEDRVRRVFADLRDDSRAVVKLYRRGPANKIFWCDDISISDFDAGGFQLIREKFGPGEYQIRVYGNGGVKTKADINIMGATQSSGAAVSAPNGNGELGAVLAAIQQQNQMMMDMVRQQVAPAPAVDPMSQMKSMMELMVLMKTATAAPPTPPASTLSEIVAAMRELKSVSKEINPETEDKEPSMMQMAAQVIPLLQQGLSNQQSGPVAPVAIPQSFALAEPPQEIQQNPIQTAESETEVNALQKMQLFALISKLVKMASEKGNTDEASDLILDKAPDEVIEFLESDDWWPVLSQAAPQVAPFAEWFKETRDKVLSGLEDDAPPELPQSSPAQG